MGGQTIGKLGEQGVYLFAGYRGSGMNVGDVSYSSTSEYGVSRDEMAALLGKHTKAELISLLLDFAKNGEEA